MWGNAPKEIIQEVGGRVSMLCLDDKLWQDGKNLKP